METTTGSAIVLAEGGDPTRVLLARRSTNKRAHPGFWELPGGALEDGETPEGCIRREVLEELGIEVGDLTLLYVDCSEHHGQRHIVFVHQGTFTEAELHLPSWEVSDHRLVHPLAPLPERVFPRVPEELQQYARAHGLTASPGGPGSFDQKAPTWDQDFRVVRARAVAREIARHVPGPWGRVLDFGCGTGLLGWNFLGQAGSVTFADASAGMLDQVAKKLASANPGEPPTGRILDLGQRTLESSGDGPYDLVVSLQVLHHIEDVEAQIAALAGVVAEGGALCLADLDAEDGSFHTDEVVPHQGFDRVAIQRAVEAAGLRVVSSTTPYVNRKIIGGEERLFPVFLVVGRR